MAWFGNRRYLFGFLAATAIMLLVGFSIVAATRQFRSAAMRVESSQQRIALIAQVRADLYGAIATQRSYLLTGDPTLLHEYRATRPRLRTDLARLAALARGEPRRTADGELLERLVQARFTSADTSIIAFQRGGMAAAQAQLRTNRGRLIRQRIDSLAHAMETRERAEMRRHASAATRAANVLLVLGVLGIPLSLALAWWIFALLSREVDERERLQESLRQQSIRDPLTGLYNRRYLEESLPRELARCERTGRPLAVMMLDLDHFKSLNDFHGHEAGDQFLLGFARLLQSLCRREDIACRYGGEEFTLILPEMDRETALSRAHRIREETARLTVRHGGQDLGPATISIGIVMFPEHGGDGSPLEAADAALYRAKHAGRNRVEIA